VICSDVSDEVLDRCRERAAERGVLEQCSFVKASAGDLSPIGDQAVDAVAVRSVLIYEPEKANAFAEEESSKTCGSDPCASGLAGLLPLHELECLDGVGP
jgi:hypothetical protein